MLRNVSFLILAEDQYILQDPEAEQKYKFSLRESVSSSNKIFKDTTFSVTPDCFPDLGVLKELIEIFGGHVLLSFVT